MERFKLADWKDRPLKKCYEWPIVKDKEIDKQLRHLFDKSDGDFVMLGPVRHNGETFYSWQSRKAYNQRRDWYLDVCAIDTRPWRNYPKESL